MVAKTHICWSQRPAIQQVAADQTGSRLRARPSAHTWGRGLEGVTSRAPGGVARRAGAGGRAGGERPGDGRACVLAAPELAGAAWKLGRREEAAATVSTGGCASEREGGSEARPRHLARERVPGGPSGGDKGPRYSPPPGSPGPGAGARRPSLRGTPGSPGSRGDGERTLGEAGDVCGSPRSVAAGAQQLRASCPQTRLVGGGSERENWITNGLLRNVLCPRSGAPGLSVSKLEFYKAPSGAPSHHFLSSRVHLLTLLPYARIVVYCLEGICFYYIF